MKLIIDITEDLYDFICKYPERTHGEIVYKAVAEGTVIKGCGNLLDENRLVSQLIYSNFLKDDVKCGELTKILDSALVLRNDEVIQGETDN